jgi:hypothetical protein
MRQRPPPHRRRHRPCERQWRPRYPGSTLTDNGTVFTNRLSGGQGGRNKFENELRRRGVTQINSTPTT